MINVYEARRIGRAFCNDTEGSDHYKEGGIEPIDMMISKGLFEDFAICNMIKYATRFKKTRKNDDLRKVSDYAQILCGIHIDGERKKLDGTATPSPITPEIREELFKGVEPKVEGWSEEDEKHIDNFCRNIGGCDYGCPFKCKITSTTWCDEWCKAHPAEARAIMDKWESERK